MKGHRIFVLAFVLCATPAFASVTVSSPAPGATVPTTSPLVASATACSSQVIDAMGYSLDNSTNTFTVSGSNLVTQFTAPVGPHILHVKSWGKKGASCDANLPIVVVQAQAAPPTPVTDVAVSAPASGATVVSPFTLAATGTQCKSQPIAAMGYSLDSSWQTATAPGSSLGASVTADPGQHVLHIKAWGNHGAVCVTQLAVNVLKPLPPPSGPEIPANAIVVDAIHNLDSWKAKKDPATGTGKSSGITTKVLAPALSGSSRQFITNFSEYSGELYSVNIGADSNAHNFVYDTFIYVASPTHDIANIEMDFNQVTPDRKTVIFGFQCDGWSHTWDYTENAGSLHNPQAHWLHSNQTCDPGTWTPDTWHHVQVSYTRDETGNVTYKSVWLDGQQQDLNVTVFSMFDLHWRPSLIVNFQVDGMTSSPGTSTIYLDKLSIARW